jgi:multiple sugar transport system permease protein
MTRSRGIESALWSAVLVAAALAVLIPLLLVLQNSFKSPQEFVSHSPLALPSEWTFENFAHVLGSAGLGTAMGRSALVVGFLLVTQLPLSILAGYAFAALEFPGRRLLYGATLAAVAIPGIALVVPLYLMVAAVDLRETYWALVLPWSLGSAFAVFLLRESFASIPREQLDAARVDGAREPQILWRIVLPQSRPTIAVLVVVTVVANWNAFLWPQVIAGSGWPVATVVTAGLRAQYAQNWTLVLAACTLMIVPVVVLFALVQRYLPSFAPVPRRAAG